MQGHGGLAGRPAETPQYSGQVLNLTARLPRTHHNQLKEEAKRRGKPWLYAKGWNNAYESQGHHLSDSDRRAAMAPSEKEHAN